MQAVIDRAIRSVTVGNLLSLQPKESKVPLAEREEAALIAIRLLDNYKDQLSRRARQAD